MGTRGVSTSHDAAASGGTTTTVSALIESLSCTDPNVDTFPVYNPASRDATDRKQMARIKVMGQDEAAEAVRRARDALPSWRDGTTAATRANALRRWSDLMKENVDTMATIMTLESGKPLNESRGEVAYAASFLEYYAGEAVRPTGAGGGFVVPTPFADAATGGPRGHVMALNGAVGTCAVITPWNFPAAMITRKVGPAFAAGCTVVAKPSELTPLTALYMHRLAAQAGIPPGVLEMVTADASTASQVGRVFCTDPSVRKVSFTGSTAVGKTLMRQSSETVQRLSLELGGNAVFVVFDDADIDQAVQAAMAAKFRNAGQTCVCADRFLIHQNVHEEFVNKLRVRVEALVVGDGMDPSTTLGPLITPRAVVNVAEKVDEAIAEGAICVTGGRALADEKGPNFYAPTVLTNVGTASRIWDLETFGPVVAIRSFDTDEEALEIANASRTGLASYFCTKDLTRAFWFSKR